MNNGLVSFVKGLRIGYNSSESQTTVFSNGNFGNFGCCRFSTNFQLFARYAASISHLVMILF